MQSLGATHYVLLRDNKPRRWSAKETLLCESQEITQLDGPGSEPKNNSPGNRVCTHVLILVPLFLGLESPLLEKNLFAIIKRKLNSE